MTLLVRDEEDILKDNIDFHLNQGVDFIIATDNCSIDSTRDILIEYEAQGKLLYLYEGEDDYSQYKWVTRMARIAYSEYGADWVINNDADEFWWPKNGTLKDTFSALTSHNNVVEASRTNFVFIKDCSEKLPFYDNMIYRDVISLNPLGKPLPSKVAHIGSACVVVKQGNHGVDEIGEQNVIKDVIEIFHFPVRTYRQILNKITKGGAAYSRNKELPEAIGRTWRELYKKYQRTGTLDDYIESISYFQNELENKVREGKIITDTRLKDYMHKLICHSK